MGIDYLGLLNYLENNRGLPYSKLESCTDPIEKARLQKIYDNGIKYNDELKKIADLFIEKHKEFIRLKSSWLDGGNTKTREYLWIPMKNKDFDGSNISISLFVEMSPESHKARFRVSLEIKNDYKNAIELAKYHSFLNDECIVDPSLSFVSGSNEETILEKLPESKIEIRQNLQNGKYKKVQVSKQIEQSPSMTDADYENQILDGLEKLLPVYEYVLKDETQKVASPVKQYQIPEDNMNKKIKLNNCILYGPPGTGKTYKMQKEYIDNFDKENCFITTFHQAFSYEEFVEGLKPYTEDNNVKYKIEPGIFYQACERAANLAGYKSLDDCIMDENRTEKINRAISEKKIVLLCIDEINRANVSAVFGDLISLIEDSKRLGANCEMVARLPYSKKLFGVPANLLVIGTMNTADRSIQLLDSALRRRFKFEELLPDYKVLGETTTSGKILKALNNRIRALLDKDHQIGHSYFVSKNSDLEIFEVIRDNVLPLLEEYFYNETDKIRRVLNETQENPNKIDSFYIVDEDAKNAISFTDEFDEEKSYFMVNPELIKIDNEKKAAVYLTHLFQ